MCTCILGPGGSAQEDSVHLYPRPWGFGTGGRHVHLYPRPRQEFSVCRRLENMGVNIAVGTIRGAVLLQEG